MPLIADLSDSETALLWIGVIEAAILTVGGAVVALYFGFRKKRRDDKKEETQAHVEEHSLRVKIEHEEKQYDIEGLLRVIGVLERSEEKYRAAYDVLQAGLTERLLAADRAASEKVAKADDARHEVERKNAILEERNRILSRRIKELEGDSADDRPAVEGAGG